MSACVISYNHAALIRKALDSVAMQKVNFDMEIVIADDCSKDGTVEIIEEFIRQYPGKVNFLKREKNLGPAENFLQMLAAAKGKYVAYLEGDDYWINENKLQIQVDFLEKNEAIALSSHNSFILKDGKEYPFNKDKKYSDAPYEKIYTAEDYIIRDFFHSSAIVYRKTAFKELPDWYKNAFGGDYFLVLLLAMNGDIHYVNDMFSVYRINTNSVSHYSSRYQIFKNFDLHLNKFNEYSGYRYNKLMKRKIFSFRFNFYYYHPNYFKKMGFFFSNILSILKLSPSVISRTARFKMLIPTYFLRSKVDLFAKKG